MSRSVCAGEFKTGARGINQTSLRRVAPLFFESHRAKRAATLTFLHAHWDVLLSGGIFFLPDRTQGAACNCGVFDEMRVAHGQRRCT